MDKPRLGSDPLAWIQDSRKEKPGKQRGVKEAKQKGRKPDIQKTIKPDIQAGQKRKVTYMMPSPLVKQLKMLGAETERELSDLVSEAVEALVKKYKGGR